MSERETCVLVVDDEWAIRRFLRVSLEGHHYRVLEADSAKAALQVMSTGAEVDAVVLDLGLPDSSGIEVTRKVRLTSHVPIIFLSVQGHERTKIEALDAGADDYLTKPFSVDELLARLRAALRRFRSTAPATVYQCGELRVDLESRSVRVKDQEISLTPTEFSLLGALLRHSGKVMTHRQLLREVWGEAYEHDSHLLRVNICNLRRKLEADPVVPHYIRTEPGVGYRLTETGPKRD